MRQLWPNAHPEAATGYGKQKGSAAFYRIKTDNGKGGGGGGEENFYFNIYKWLVEGQFILDFEDYYNLYLYVVYYEFCFCIIVALRVRLLPLSQAEKTQHMCLI